MKFKMLTLICLVFASYVCLDSIEGKPTVDNFKKLKSRNPMGVIIYKNVKHNPMGVIIYPPFGLTSKL